MLFTTNGAPHPNHRCSSMKKQINPSIKAHLIRSSFYVLLLLAVCVIPFALAQRNTTRRAVAKPKMAATHRAPSATAQSRNDVTAAVKGTAIKGKSKSSAQSPPWSKKALLRATSRKQFFNLTISYGVTSGGSRLSFSVA